MTLAWVYGSRINFTCRVAYILRRVSFFLINISEIDKHLRFDDVYESMSKNYTVWLKHKDSLHVHNTSHGTVNTNTAINKMPKYFCVFPLLKMPFRVTVCEVPDGGLEGESTEQF
jgi:hypothetical protein